MGPSGCEAGGSRCGGAGKRAHVEATALSPGDGAVGACEEAVVPDRHRAGDHRGQTAAISRHAWRTIETRNHDNLCCCFNDIFQQWALFKD